MTQQVLAIQPVPSQTFQATLGKQNCLITLQQMATGLFASLSISGNPIISGKFCNDRVNLIRQAYLGFVGWLYFVDTAPGPETQPVTADLSQDTSAPWTADSDSITADSSAFTADSSSGGDTGQQFASVPLGLNPNYAGLGSRFLLVYES